MQFDSPEDLERYIDEKNIRFFKMGVVDIDGVLRGKYINRSKFSSALRDGLGFCDVVMGWDSQDKLYERGGLTGWQTGYKDAPVSLDLKSVRLLPGEDDTLFVLGNLGAQYDRACPRSLLSRISKKASELGYQVRASLEYEFFVFDESPESVRRKHYRNLVPLSPGMFGYSILRNSVHSDLYRELLDAMTLLEAPIEGLHTETGPGVMEAALCHAPVCEAGDRAALFKTFTKVFMQQRGYMATFMAKYSNDYPGQSGHVHLSLEDEQGKNVFHSPNGSGAPLGAMSDTFRHFVAGQVQLLPQLLPMVCSTVNAYRRLVPGFWAPTHASWGIDNRTTAVRAIVGGPSSARSEYRLGPADANPYLVLSAALASGLYGIEHQLEIPPVEGNAYEKVPPGTPRLASSLGEATTLFHASQVARELFGDVFVDHFSMTRFWEEQEYQKHVSDFELNRYFEVI